MKYFLSLLFLLILVSQVSAIPSVPADPVFPTVTSGGTTYHVKKTGNDSTGDGSDGNPWLTIQHAHDTVSCGDVIKVHVGSYNEEVDISKTCTNSTWLTIQENSGDEVTIDVPDTGNDNGLDFAAGAEYIYVEGISIISTDTSRSGHDLGIMIRPSTAVGRDRNIYINNNSVDANQVLSRCVEIGVSSPTNGQNTLWFDNVDCTETTTEGFGIYNYTYDVVIANTEISYTGGDCISVGQPSYSGQATVSKRFTLVDSVCIEPQRDAFDIGAQDTIIIKRVKSYGAGSTTYGYSEYGDTQGWGIKLWGETLWVINYDGYYNFAGGLNIKNIEDNCKLYALHSTIDSGAIAAHGIMFSYESGGNYMGTGNAYLYNNIIWRSYHSSFTAILNKNNDEFSITEEGYNYYFGNTDAIAIDLRNDGAVDKTYDISDMGPAGSWNTDTGLGTGSIGRDIVTHGLSNPGWMVRANDETADHTLISDSLAIDAGIDKGVTDDIDGNSRPQGSAYDIGAYEYAMFISNPSPPDDAENVVLDVVITFTRASNDTSVDVWFDEGTCAAEGHTTKVLDDQDVSQYDPGGLTENTTYCWAVDENYVGGTETGIEYEFTTVGIPDPGFTLGGGYAVGGVSHGYMAGGTKGYTIGY